MTDPELPEDPPPCVLCNKPVLGLMYVLPQRTEVCNDCIKEMYKKAKGNAGMVFDWSFGGSGAGTDRFAAKDGVL